MRKVKANGQNFKMKPIDRGPRFIVAFHGTDKPEKAKEALMRVFDINEALADVAIKEKPSVICRDLDQGVATDYVRRLAGTGDFRVWLESAAGRLKQMNLKQKDGISLVQRPEVRKR